MKYGHPELLDRESLFRFFFWMFTRSLLPLICWATLYGFAPWPPGHQQMF